MPETSKKIPAQPAHSICSSTFEIENDQNQAFVDSMVRKAGEYLEAGDVAAAEKCLQVGLERFPAHPQCLAYIAVCVAVRQRNLTAAEELAKKIVRDHPNDATAYYALGRVHLAASRRKSAFRHFAKAQHLAGSNKSLKGELERIEPRRSPLIPFLSRNHFLNVLCGKLRACFIRRPED